MHSSYQTEEETKFVSNLMDQDLTDPVALVRGAGFDVATWFEYGDFDGVDFRQSDTRGVSFYKARLDQALMTTHQVKRAKDDGARGVPPTFDNAEHEAAYHAACEIIERARGTGSETVDLGVAPCLALTRIPLSILNLPYLVALHLNFTDVTDVSALSGLTSLQELYLRDTGVTDISALSGLTYFRTLDLGYTGVTDISALSGLVSLKALYLHSTRVTDVSVLDHIENLKIQGP